MLGQLKKNHHLDANHFMSLEALSITKYVLFLTIILAFLIPSPNADKAEDSVQG